MKKIVDTGFEACIHFAALKAVGESVEDPLRYYDTNVGGTIALVQALLNAGVPTFVFSSSATVYGESDRLPLTEEMPMGSATNPYGWTKIFMERILQDVQTSNPAWSVALLRYFNPVGAHPSGLIGEDPQGVPSNLMPYVARVAEGTLAKVRVFGDDYPTPDGTGVRDYVHVVDIAAGHVTALEAHHRDPGVHTYNLGTGRGTSVLEVVAAYEKASGNAVPYEVVDRRPGDVAANWADVSKAKEILNWVASRDLATMCADSWNWIRHKG
jgi:UDP-glucose 4-epimerase